MSPTTDPVVVSGFILMLCIMPVLSFACYLLGRWHSRPATNTPFDDLPVLVEGTPVDPVAAPYLKEVLRLRERVAALLTLIGQLEEVREAVKAVVVTTLPARPEPIITHRPMEQFLMDENQELRRQLDAAVEWGYWRDRLRKRYLDERNSLRRRIRLLQGEADLRHRAVVVASKNQARAATVAEAAASVYNVLLDAEVEALLPGLFEEVEHILTGAGVST